MLREYDFDLFRVVCRNYEAICKSLDEGLKWSDIYAFLKASHAVWRLEWSIEDVKTYFRVVDDERRGK